MKENDKALQKTIQLVILKLGEEEFGVEINLVREILRVPVIAHIPDAPGFLEGGINLRGQIIAIINLAKQFDLPPVSEVSKSARIVVVEAGKNNVGMMVDAVPQVLNIAEKDIEETPDLFHSKVKIDYIRGIGKLAERLIILLDLSKVLSLHDLAAVAKIAPGEKNG